MSEVKSPPRRCRRIVGFALPVVLTAASAFAWQAWHADRDRGVYGVAFSPDGTRLASAGQDYTAVVWDAGTGKARLTLRHGDVHVFAARFSPDGRRLATADGEGVHLWEVATGAEVAALEAAHGNATSVVFSPDGARAAAGQLDWGVAVWDVASGRRTLSFTGHNREVGDLAFSPDGRWVAVYAAFGGPYTLTQLRLAALAS